MATDNSEISYCPGYPHYYTLGGIPLDPEDIGPRADWKERIDSYALSHEGEKAIRRADGDPDKILNVYRRELKKAQKRLQGDIKSYEHIMREKPEGWDSMSQDERWEHNETNWYNGFATSLSLKYNHISYQKASICACRWRIEELSRRAGSQRELFSESGQGVHYE